MIAVDAEKCVRCGACVRDCIVEVLKPGADGVPCVASGEERFHAFCNHVFSPYYYYLSTLTFGFPNKVILTQ